MKEQMTCNEELDNNIEKLDYTYKNMYGNISQHRQSEKELIDKINEIIDVINELKKGK